MPPKPEELPDYFRLVDVIGMPSTGEDFGIIFLEVASEVRVIGGGRDGMLGSLVHPENNDELVVAMEAALDDLARTADRTDEFKRFVSHLDVLYQFCVFRLSSPITAEIVAFRWPAGSPQQGIMPKWVEWVTWKNFAQSSLGRSNWAAQTLIYVVRPKHGKQI